MNRPADAAAISRARELSRGMIEVADRGDIQGVIELDALRSSLLREVLGRGAAVSESEREILDEIFRINASVIARLETMRAGTQGKLEVVNRGKRALAAYSSVGRGGA